MRKSTQELLRENYRATKRRPCPVCGKPDWCLIAKDGTTAICSRTPSKVAKGDAGYLHQLAEPLPKYEPRRDEKPPSNIDWNMMSLRFRQNITADQLTELGRSLGVTSHSLFLLETGWSLIHSAFTNPMRDHRENMIGIRLRRPDGFKYAITGSSNGLFIPANLTEDGPLIVVEGASDVAALLDLGFDAIGRPSCSSCVYMTQDFVASRRNREWVIFEDHDEPKKRPDGSAWYPGQEGAAKLAEALAETGKPGKVIAPRSPHKDVRAWKQAGATRQQVMGMIALAKYFSVTEAT